MAWRHARYWDARVNYCGGDCDLDGPQHFRDDCIFHSPRSAKTARRLRKVQDAGKFAEKVAMCIALLFHVSGKSARLVLNKEQQNIDSYVTASLADFEKCFGVTEV